jgi:hypothetical protein
MGLRRQLACCGVAQSAGACHEVRVMPVAPLRGFCYNVRHNVLRANVLRAHSLFGIGGVMVKVIRRLPFVIVLAAIGSFAASSGVSAAPQTQTHGDNLLVHRVQQENSMNLPRRGMSMAQVEKTFGAPQSKLSPRGGDSSKHPVINRWDYANFIVYFERSHVIHSVLNTPAGNNTNPAAVN